MRNDKSGIGTLAVTVLALAIVGASLFAFNEYEKNALEHQASTVILAGYDYNVSALSEVQDNLPYARYNCKIYEDKEVFIAHITTSGYMGVLGYDYSDDSTYTIETYGLRATLDVDIGEYGTVYDYTTDDAIRHTHARAYVTSNGTKYTSNALCSVYSGIVTAGESMVWANGSKIMAFSMLNWTEYEVCQVTLGGTYVLRILNGAEDNNIIYRIGHTTAGVGYYWDYYKLNVRTGATSMIASELMPIPTVYYDNSLDTGDIYGDWVVRAEHTNQKLKASTIYGGNGSATLDTFPYRDHAFTQIHESFVVGIYKTMTNTYTVKFYDIETGFNQTVGAFGSESPSYISVGLGEDRGVITDYSHHYTFTYSRAGASSQDNTTNGTANGHGNGDADTALGQLSQFAKSNWLVVIAVAGISIAAVYLAWRKWGGVKYGEDMKSIKSKLNWGIVISVVVIGFILGLLLFG